jgi:hypothetical protein
MADEKDKNTSPSGPPVNPFPQPQPTPAVPLGGTMTFWQQLRGNKYFVAITSAVATFLVTAAYNWANAGTPVLTVAQLKTTALAAAGVAITALYHLYISPSAKG